MNHTKPPDEKMSERIILVMTPILKAQVWNAAKDKGVTCAEYIRQAIRKEIDNDTHSPKI